MANGGNRPIAPVRRLIAAVLGTVATFVMVFGLGMTSWAIVALGLALLVLAIALATVRTGGRTWVTGEATVQSASEPPTAYAFGRCEVQLLIDAPGLPTRSRKIIEPRVPVAKWPVRGQTLPIRVALDDQRHIRILWEEVPTRAETTVADADLPPEYADTEPLDEVLIEPQAPPWADRNPDDDLREPPAADPILDEPILDDVLLDDVILDEPPRNDPDPTPEHREPVVVVHQRPGEPVVLEGTFTETPPITPLPRRAATAPTPRPPAEERFDVPLDPIDVPLDDFTADAARPHPEPADLPYDPPVVGEPLDVDGESAAPISGVGITLLVTDLARSLAFYRDLLGFVEVDGGPGNAVLASGATRLVLREITEAAPINRRVVHINLEVDDIDAAYERLRTAGVRFSSPPQVVNRGSRLEGWAAAFRDPDGHGIALTRWRTRAEA